MIITSVGNSFSTMAVFGIFGTKTANVASSTYYGLYALQHRGQASSGIVVNDDGVFHSYKDSGLVNEVFTHRRLDELGVGQMALGNVRYGTSATKERTRSKVFSYFCVSLASFTFFVISANVIC